MKDFPTSLRAGLLLAAVLTGLALRTWGLPATSASHHDEAVYWMSGLLLFADNSLHSALPLQSPPGYPFAISIVHRLMGGVWYPAGALVSALFGTATIPLVYLIGRRFAPWLGLAAAWAMAVSDLHVAFSRTWLTDATFSFWFALAMLGVIRMFGDGRARWVILVTTATAVAWSVKYNGWMPIAIGVSAVIFEGARRRRFLRFHADAGSPIPETAEGTNQVVCAHPLPSLPGLLARLTVAGGVAIALFLPWYQYVERNLAGGYATVAEHHGKFFEGAGAWFGHTQHLALVLPAFRHAGWLLSLAAGIVIACGALFGFFRRSTEKQNGEPSSQLPTSLQGTIALVVVLAGGAATYAGTDTLWFAASVPGTVVCLVWGTRRDVLLAAWIGAFLVLVPLYHPYVRLLVPALPAAVLVSLRGAALTFAARESSLPNVSTRRIAGWVSMATTLLLCWSVGRFHFDEIRGVWARWSSHRSYRAFTDLVEKHTPPDTMLVCLTQPVVWCGLDRAYRLPVTSPLITPNATGRPVFLAVDFMLNDYPDLFCELRSLAPCLSYVGDVENDIAVPALLDRLTPRQFWATVAKGSQATVTPGVGPLLNSADPNRIVLYRLDRRCAEAAMERGSKNERYDDQS